MLKITNGPSFKHFYFGVVWGVISVLILNFYPEVFYVGIIGLLFSFFLIPSFTGTVIDLEKKQIKHYVNLFFFKIGNWQNLTDFYRVELLLNNNSQGVNYRSVVHTVKVRSFYISILNRSKQRIELKEFTDYKEARKMLDSISDRLQIEKVDRQELILAKNKKSNSGRFFYR